MTLLSIVQKVRDATEVGLDGLGAVSNVVGKMTDFGMKYTGGPTNLGDSQSKTLKEINAATKESNRVEGITNAIINQAGRAWKSMEADKTEDILKKGGKR